MSQDKDAPDGDRLFKKNDKEEDTRSLRIKQGIAKARASRRKWGRPSIMESKGDPELALKATALHSQGLTWSEIASNLEIGKTTARRLVRQNQRERYHPLGNDANNIATNRTVTCDLGENEDEQEVKDDTSIYQPQGNQLSLHDEVLNKMPKTFQILNSLLERARQKQAK